MKKILSTLLSLIMIFVFTATCMASNGFDQNNGKHKGIVKDELKQEYEEKVNEKTQVEESDQTTYVQNDLTARPDKTSSDPERTLKSDDTQTQAADVSSTDEDNASSDEDVNKTGSNNVPVWAKGYVKKAAKKNANLGFFNRFHSKAQVAKAEAAVVIAKAAGIEPADVSDMNFDNILISKDDAGYIKALWLEKITFTRTGIAALLDRIISSDDEDSENAVVSVSLSKDTAAVEQGESISLEATVEFADKTTDNNVTWTSSDTSLAAVDENGKVTAADDKTGTVTITATATKDGVTKSAACEVEVTNSDSTSD